MSSYNLATFRPDVDAQLRQVQQHVASLQAKEVADALSKCVQALLSNMAAANHPSPRTAGQSQPALLNEQHAGWVRLHVQCCLCMVQRACQLSTASQSVMQEVTGLLQHELQQSPALLEAIYCQHAHLLLQDATSLDVLLRMVPLFKAEQQIAVYQALRACLHSPTKADAAERPQASCLPALPPLASHCHRQLDRCIPQSQAHMHTQQDRPFSILREVNEACEAEAQSRVHLQPHLPSLLALALALPQSISEAHGVKKSSQSCSWSASCGTASSTSASSPGAAPQPPADLPQGTHPADNSQLSAVTAVSACASEAAQPDQADAPGQGCLAEPLRVAETASCTAGFESQAVDGAVALNKAGLLVQCLMDTRAVLALLGFNTGKAQLAEHKLASQTQTEAPIQQTQAAQVSQPGPKPAVSLSTAVAPPSGEVPKAPVMHQLTKPSQATANSDAERPQQQACTASQGFESSLLALLGLVGAAEGSRRGADGTGLAKADEEEEAGVRMARLAGSAAEVIEVLLDASLTQPEVMSALLASSPASEGSKASDSKGSKGRPAEAVTAEEHASVMVLRLLALHSAIQVAAKSGKSKARRQPLYITLGGARRLLNQATQLLTVSSQSKPQRRRTSHAASKQSSLPTQSTEQASLDADLAAYLLCLVGHVVQRHNLSQQQQLSLASKAVTVYKLLLQEGVFGNKPAFHCASAEAVRAAAAAQAAASPLCTAQIPTAALTHALSDKQDAFSRPTGKRLALVLDSNILPAVKKSRTTEEPDISGDSTEPQRKISTITQTKAAEVHRQPKPRRVIPEQIVSAVDMIKSARVSSSPGQPHRIISEIIDTDHCRNSNSSSKMAVSDRRHMSAVKRNSGLAMCGSDDSSSQLPSDSGDSSCAGSDEEPEDGLDAEGGLDGGSEGGQPRKWIAELGAAGDAWWNDFIAAKEKMLTDVLQDSPEDYCEDTEGCHETDTECKAQPTSSPSMSHPASFTRGAQGSALPRSSSSRMWRLLSQQEAARKRACQKPLLEAVKLLSCLLSSIPASESAADSGLASHKVTDAAARHSAQSVSTRPLANSPSGVLSRDADPLTVTSGRMNSAATETAMGLLKHDDSGQHPGQAGILILPILQGLCAPQELKAHVITACQLVESGMGYAGMTAAITGASKLPLGAACLVLLGDLVSCYAQDFGPAPALLEAYLSLLSSVASLASSEPCTVIQGRGCTPPLRLLSDCLQVLIARLPLSAMKPDTLTALLKVVLDPLAESDAAICTAATLWAVVQGCGVGPGGVTWPDWAQCVTEPWAHAWMYKINARQRTPALVQLLGHCNTCLQALLPDQAPTPACYPASSAPADQQPSSDPASLPSVLPAVPDSTAAQAASTLASARDSSTAQAASTSADLQVLLAPGGELKSAKPAHNDHVSESASASTKAREEESLESLRCSVLEGSVGQALAEATREVVLAVLRGCDDTESSLRSSDAVLSGVAQLASRMLRVCAAAQLFLIAWLGRAQATDATAQAASTDDSATCDIIDLTADDENDVNGHMPRWHVTIWEGPAEQHSLSQHSQVQCKAEPSQQAVLPEHDRTHPPDSLPSPATASALQPELRCQTPDNIPDGSLHTDSMLGESAAASTSSEAQADLSDSFMADMCMGCAYGMDLAAVASCLLDQVEVWPDQSQGQVEQLQAAVLSFKQDNSSLLSKLMPQNDSLNMPAQQAALHDCLGNAIQQHCHIVGQDSSDRSESESGLASDCESDACKSSVWSESESESAEALCLPEHDQPCKAQPASRQQAHLKHRWVRKKACRPSAVNPFIQAALAEACHTCTDMSGDHDGDGGSYSDLEDFIVCKPDRSYTSLFAQHYKYSAQEQGC